MSKLTEKELLELKEKKRGKRLYKVMGVKDSKGESHDFVFGRIERTDIDLAHKESANSPTKALELQMVSTLVAGDVQLIADKEVFRAISDKWHIIQKANEPEELGEL
jgi:hypothetical protein